MVVTLVGYVGSKTIQELLKSWIYFSYSWFLVVSPRDQCVREFESYIGMSIIQKLDFLISKA